MSLRPQGGQASRVEEWALRHINTESPLGCRATRPVLDCGDPAGGTREERHRVKRSPCVSIVPDQNTRFLSMVSFYPHSPMNRLLGFFVVISEGKA